MYSNIQKQCLQQLGIQAYEMKSQKSEPKPTMASSIKSSTKTPRPSLSSLLKSDNNNFDWADVSESFKKDLTVALGQPNFSGDTVTFANASTWRIEEKSKQLSFDQQQLTTAPPDQLTVADKKAIWQWLSHQEGMGEN